MPSRFTRRVLRVLRNETETKRVVQTKYSNHPFDDLRAPEQFGPDTGKTDGANEGSETTSCWKLTHNRIQVWPICLHTCYLGPYSGFERWNLDYNESPAARQYISNSSQSTRNGAEIWCKGVSLKCSVSLDKVMPTAVIKIMLVRSEKGDTPHPDSQDDPKRLDSNFFMGYSQNKEIDMIDTRRHRIVKTWYKKLYQNHFTSAGGDITADGNAGENATMVGYVLSNMLVLKDEVAKTAAEWLALIESDYPEYYITTKDHNVQRTAFDSHLLSIGYDASLKTLVARDDFTDWPFLLETTPPTAKAYAVIDDQNNANATTDIWDMYNNAGLGNVLSTAWFDDTNTTYKAHQVVLVKKPKLSAGAPSSDVVQMKHHALINLWIPGYLFGHGGRLTYADRDVDAMVNGQMNPEKFNGFDLEGAYEYNLVWYAYSNYKTWTKPGIGSEYGKVLWFNDFQQVMYFKDV